MKRALHTIFCGTLSLVIAGCLLTASPIWADDAATITESVRSDAPHYPTEKIKKTITDILSKPEFSTEETQRNLRYTGKPDVSDKKRTGWGESLAEFMQYLASLAEFILWLAAFVLIVLMVVYRSRWLHLFSARSSPPESIIPERLFGLDVRQEHLPADIVAAAMALWSGGRVLEAISLLYRGALSRLMIGHGVMIASSATEGECLQRVNGAVHAELAHYFGMLTQVWLVAVYAQRLPDAATVKALCEGFNAHFVQPESIRP
jgi:Domain of unknown function (DUF4129)